MIAGLEDISGGELIIDDRVVNDVKPKDRDIAMVFQNYALYPHMTVYENMAFSLKLKKMKKDEIDKKVKEAAKIIHLEEVLDRKPKALSGGQRQRVALGRAIVRNPKIFLMDEPLSNLDAKLRTEMRAQLSKLHKQLGCIFIYVTHNQLEAMTMGDRIVVMKDGVVQQIDAPKKIYDMPNNKFVASFIGSPQMNFVVAKIIEENESLYALLENEKASYKLLINTEDAKILKEKNYLNKIVSMGIRPEAIYRDERRLQKHLNSLIEATVSIKELMGADIYAYLEFMDKEIIAKFDGKIDVEEGETLKLAIDMDRIHFFDMETEMNILL